MSALAFSAVLDSVRFGHIGECRNFIFIRDLKGGPMDQVVQG